MIEVFATDEHILPSTVQKIKMIKPKVFSFIKLLTDHKFKMEKNGFMKIVNFSSLIQISC